MNRLPSRLPPQRKMVVAAALAVSLWSGPARALPDHTSFDLALGQVRLDAHHVNGPNERSLQNPNNIAIDRSHTPNAAYISDGNSRVLAWRDVARLEAGAPPDLVLGQPDFYGAQFARIGNQGFTASYLAVDKDGTLWVSDFHDARVLGFRWPFDPSKSMSDNVTADILVGQDDFSQGFYDHECNRGFGFGGEPGLSSDQAFCFIAGIAVDVDGNLYVADTMNNRVVGFKAPIPERGARATLLFGQDTFFGNPYGGGCNRNRGAVDATTLCRPNGVYVQQDGPTRRLYIADSANERVVVYDDPLHNQARANRVFGKTSLTEPPSNFYFGPDRLRATIEIGGDDQGTIYISDSTNRVLGFAPPILANDAGGVVSGASYLIGQPNFYSTYPNRNQPLPSASSVVGPVGLAIDAQGHMLLADRGNNRVLTFDDPRAVSPSAARVIGQPDFSHGGANFVRAEGLAYPSATAIDRPDPQTRPGEPIHVYVADFGNSRVLGWRDLAALGNGKPADLVIGQDSFHDDGCNRNGLSDRSLCFPLHVAVDKRGDLWVADTYNHRVLRFPRPFSTLASHAPQRADLVLGQMSFAWRLPNGGETTPPSARTLRAPAALAIETDGESGTVWVADRDNDRVLGYSPPFASGMKASFLLAGAGVTDFDQGGCPSRPSGGSLCAPAGLALDADNNLWVADRDNHRVVLLPINARTAGTPVLDLSPLAVLGQPSAIVVARNSGSSDPSVPTAMSLNGPSGVSVELRKNAGGKTEAVAIVVADTANNRVLVYDPITLGFQPAARMVIGQDGKFDKNGIDTDPDNTHTFHYDEPGNVSKGFWNPVGVLAIPEALFIADTGNVTSLGRVVSAAAVPPLNVTGGNRVVIIKGASFPPPPPPDADAGVPAAPGMGPRVDLQASGGCACQLGGRDAPLSPLSGAVLLLGALALGRRRRRPGALLLVLLLLPGVARAVAVGPGYDLVLGQTRLDVRHRNSVTSDGVDRPLQVALDRSHSPNHLYVADADNARVLAWRDVDKFKAGNPPDLIIGQADQYAAERFRVDSGSVSRPAGLAVDKNGTLWVSDEHSGRVMGFKWPFDPALTAGDPIVASFLIGQPAFDVGYKANQCNAGTGRASDQRLCLPRGLATDDNNNLYVADHDNSRVLLFADPIPALGARAAKVFGQTGFNTTNAGSCNQGQGAASGSTLCNPSGVHVQQDGGTRRLYITDDDNHRVVVYEDPLNNQQKADWVIGQPNLTQRTSSRGPQRMNRPTAVTSDGQGAIWVSESEGHRVLGFLPPFQINPGRGLATEPRYLIGQIDFYGDLPNQAGVGAYHMANLPSATSLLNPAGMVVDGQGHLVLADAGNHRVLVYKDPGRITPAANSVFGQPDFSHAGPNRVKSTGLYSPMGIAVDRPDPKTRGIPGEPMHLYVSDFGNSRVLGWWDLGALESGKAPDLVIGQPTLNDHACNGDGLPSARTLCFPRGLAVDKNGDLWVADTFNNRVLRYRRPFLSGKHPPAADLVLGQPELTWRFINGHELSSYGDDARGLFSPTALAIGDDGMVWVVDRDNRRVVGYPAPQSTGMKATRLLIGAGLSGFGVGGCPDNRANGTQLCFPSGVALDADNNLWVAEPVNNRVALYGTVPPDPAAPELSPTPLAILGQPGPASVNPNVDFPSARTLFNPEAVSVEFAPDGGGKKAATAIVVADTVSNRVLVYDPINTGFQPSARTVYGQKGSFLSQGQNIASRYDDPVANDVPDNVAHGLRNPGGVLAIPEAIFIADSLTMPAPPPSGVGGSTGQPYFVDSGNHRVLVVKRAGFPASSGTVPPVVDGGDDQPQDGGGGADGGGTSAPDLAVGGGRPGIPGPGPLGFTGGCACDVGRGAKAPSPALLWGLCVGLLLVLARRRRR